MRYLRVTAMPFGPFCAESWELAPGMNVIHGPNEAGKSSLHSALYAGLCGIRRAQGPPTKEDREFAERHRPWNGEDGSWEAGALIALECGRRIELHHDLATRTGTAMDADIPESDVSSQVVYDGAVDGSRWLGLNRRSFKAIACVRQADILGIKKSATFLRGALEEAVATAPADASVASALTRLKQYRKEHVGTSKAPTKPLFRAIEKVRRARAELATAREKRREYRECQTRVEDLGRTAERHEQAIKAKKAVQAENAANVAEGNLDRARRLETKTSHAPEPPSAEDFELAAKIRLALDRWAARPKLVGSSADQIKGKLDTDRRHVTAARAVLAEREAEKAERRLARASELGAQFPNGPPQPPVQDEQLATNVIEALALWKNRPRPVDLEGPSVEEIDREMETVLRKRTAARAVVAERERERWEHRLIQATRARWVGFLLFLLLLSGAAAAAVSWAYVPAIALALLWGGWTQWRLRHLRDQATEKSKRTDDLVRAADESSLGWLGTRTCPLSIWMRSRANARVALRNSIESGTSELSWRRVGTRCSGVLRGRDEGWLEWQNESGYWGETARTFPQSWTDGCESARIAPLRRRRARCCGTSIRSFWTANPSMKLTERPRANVRTQTRCSAILP